MSKTVEQLERDVLSLPQEDRFRLQATIESSLIDLSDDRRKEIDAVLVERLGDECVDFPHDWKDQVRRRSAEMKAERLGHA